HVRAAVVGSVVDLTARQRGRVAVVVEANAVAGLDGIADVPLPDEPVKGLGEEGEDVQVHTWRPLLLVLDERDEHAALARGSRGGLGDRADRVRDPSSATDQAAEIVALDADLQDEVAAVLQLLAGDRCRLAGARAAEKLDQVADVGRGRARGSLAALHRGPYEPVASMPRARRSAATVGVGCAPWSSQW